MYKLLRHSILIICMLAGVNAFAQTQQVGEVTTLSISADAKSTYLWELYDASVDFAKTKGNCPPTKAVFVNGNTGNQVQVKWLSAGTYFYKVTATDNCSNNLKIGKIEVQNPVLAPTIHIEYDCLNRTALLTAQNYKGTLRWNNGQTSPTIRASLGGTYSVEETYQGQTAKAEVTLAQNPSVPMVNETQLIINQGNSVTLQAECTSGTVRWFADEALTIELTNTTIMPWETATYYAVCQNEAGCQNTKIAVKVIVSDEADCQAKFDTMEIPNGLSINADGINDQWLIPSLEEYCKVCDVKAKVMIFNRWGVKIYEKENYMLSRDYFAGYSDKKAVGGSEKLPTGTYFYIIEFSNGKTKQGYIYLRTDK